jgi:hypothetical protein
MGRKRLYPHIIISHSKVRVQQEWTNLLNIGATNRRGLNTMGVQANSFHAPNFHV